MLGDGKWNSGDQGSFFKYQYGVLKLLESINAAIVALPGVDYETRTTTYEAQAGSPTPPGVGYVVGDIIVRYDIIDVATGIVFSTVWFNQTQQTTLVGAGNPNPADLVPYSPPGNVTVTNPFNLEATQLDIETLLTSLNGLVSTSALQTALNLLITTLNGTVSTSALQTTLNGLVATSGNQTLQTTLLTNIDADTGSIDSKLNTLGQKTMAGSVPVVLASDQPSIPVSASISNDTNYGIVGANTLRTAAQIGNSGGAAAFGAGAASAQTLRVVLSNDVQAITSLDAVANGSVAAGATSAGFTTDASFTGTINGVARAASTFYGFEAAPGKTLPAIPYTITAGSILIDSIA